MRAQKLLSIIVNNYNYARYLEAAVNSALEQDRELTEVIVVDDGSTDNSRDVIERFASQATTIFKQNGGQASAFNSGFERSVGEWVIFLDADDILFPCGVKHLSAVAQPHASKVTWAMPIVGPSGERCMGTAPAHAPAEGDLRQQLIDKGPLAFNYAPCSGNAWSRSFLDEVLPMPEESFRHGADGYLVSLSPLYGRSIVSREPLSAYRRHGANFLAAKNQFDMRDELRQRYPVLTDVLADHLKRCGLPFNPANWRSEYLDRLDELERAILEYVPARSSLVLVDDDALNLAGEFKSRTFHSLLERDGTCVGPPESGEEAINRLQALEQQGARYLVFMWHSYWWFECYPQLCSYLGANAVELHRSSTSVIYQIGQT